MIGNAVLSADAVTQSISPRGGWEFVATDINDIVYSVAGGKRPHLSEKTVLTLEISSELQRIQGNPEQLTDVLCALLLRAERSIPIDGRTNGIILIRTWATDGDVRLRLSTNCLDSSTAGTAGTNVSLSLTECAEIISDHGGRMYSWRPYTGEASYTIILPAISSQS